MCGISGFFHFDTKRTADAGILKKMTDVLSHRGPDDEGFFVNQNIALGHRRLAIIDLHTGHQPMFSEDRKIVLIFNGEIYNYIELREELKLCGNSFTTTSDSEVVINAYRTWGIECQNRFNGMWSFVLWDDHLKRMFISRDRIGEKPLYYSKFDESFIFASEIKSILVYGVPVKPRLEMTQLYLSMGFIPAPYTYYENIYQLMPGKYLLIDHEHVKEGTYWDLPDISEKDLINDKLHVEREFSKLFHDAVNIRMRSDVAFGAFLSGGLDSSCIVSAMTNHTSKPIKTFTMGFENKLFDERPLAKMVADKFKTEHHVGVLSSEHFYDALDKVVFQYDEPFGDPSAIPTGQISQYASKYVKMVLTGDGGDEVLSGYTTYFGERFAGQYQNLPATLRTMLLVLAKFSAKPFRGNLRYKLNRIAKVLHASDLTFEKRLLSKLCQISPDELGKIIKPEFKMVSFNEFYGEAMKKCRFKDSFYKLMYFHHKVTLPGDMLTKVDRMSMAYSIEPRIPFLDHRIIELLFSVNKNLKLKGQLNKIILRNAVANKTLPKELLNAPKKGFSVPLRDWFKQDNLYNEIKQMLLNKKGNTILDENRIENLIDQNNQGHADAGNFLWMLLVLRKWNDVNQQQCSTS